MDCMSELQTRFSSTTNTSQLLEYLCPDTPVLAPTPACRLLLAVQHPWTVFLWIPKQFSQLSWIPDFQGLISDALLKYPGNFSATTRILNITIYYTYLHSYQ